MRTLQSNFRSRVHSLQLAASMLVLAACAGVTRQPVRHTSPDGSTITVVNSHPRNIRVSLIMPGGKAYYLGTVDAISTRTIGIPAAFRDATVHLLLKVQSRSFRSIPEGAVRISSTQRPIGATSEYTIEEVHLFAGRSLELRIGQTLNQSRVVVVN